MKVLEFYKVQASGNDFILIDNRKFKIKTSRLKEITRNYCRRRFGVGADGLLAIEPSKKALFKMRIFNPDGSEAQMCGNGARCSALWYNFVGTAHCAVPTKNINFETKAGEISARIEGKNVEIKLSEPKNIRMNIPLKVLGRNLQVNFINSGVPHAVIFVEGLKKIDVAGIGWAVRFHERFKPSGANVDFVEVMGEDKIVLRTYERGVEAETLACGTGAAAAALITTLKLKVMQREIKVLTAGNEILKVYFEKSREKFTNVWLSGKADVVYKGVIYV